MVNRRLFYFIIVIFSIVLLSCYHPKNKAIVNNYQPNDSLLHYTGFAIQYNPTNLQPDWVEYTLTAEQVRATENTPKVPHHFMQDPNLPLPQATDEDYKGVHKQYGLSKGHMARHQDMK